jgi:hypothetical protein
MNHSQKQCSSEGMVTLGTRLVLHHIGCSLNHPKIMIFWHILTEEFQPMKKLTQSQCSM